MNHSPVESTKTVSGNDWNTNLPFMRSVPKASELPI